MDLKFRLTDESPWESYDTAGIGVIIGMPILAGAVVLLIRLLT